MNKYHVVVSHLAEDDLDSGAEWYASRAAGLDAKFIIKVRLSLHRIGTNPFTFSPVKKKSRYRKCKVAGFPYMIYYFINNNTVEIIAIIHTKRLNKFRKKHLK